jgi:iduronate 2-sulfatase
MNKTRLHLPTVVLLQLVLAFAGQLADASGPPFVVMPREHEDARPNVLMILVDDLKPALGCYGDAMAKTPCIDRLARRGLKFDLAYCNQAVCAPSRFTLMLGSHSTSTGLYGLGSQLRSRVPNAITLPQLFAKSGYRTESLGKAGNNGLTSQLE